VLAYLLSDGGERVLVAHNLGAVEQTLSVPVAGAGTSLLDGGTATLAEGKLTLPGHASGIWRVP